MINGVIAARAWMVLAFALPSLSGMRLDDALSLLRRQGLTVVYSTALVKPEMRVEREPRSSTARGVLDEILAPHGLRAIDGRHGELLIVAAPPPAPPPRPQPPPKARFDDEIVVVPSRTRVVGDPATGSASLTGAELRGVPNPSDDVPRALQHFPGVTGTEASASVNIRGGNADETIIAIDGLELSEPFHLKDFFNIFSTLDSSAIGRADLMTGAFPAEWGDRMGGVIDMSLLAPADSSSGSLSVGTLSGSVSSSGSTANRETTWLVSGRGWYPDVVLNADKDRTELINTDCYDVLGKVEHRFTARTTASVTFLGAYDNLGYRNQNVDEIDQSEAEERSAHVWLTVETKLSDTSSLRTILAVGRLWRDRVGSISGSGVLQIDDSRGFNFVELKQDWRASSIGKQQWRFGFDAKTADARYDYTRAAGSAPQVDTHIRPHEQSAAIYASDQIPIGPSAVAELGLRWDHQSLRGDSQLSPRINLLWNVTANSDLRLGWGRFYQSQRLNELQVEDGVTQFAAPELAEHRTAGFEQRFDGGLALRIEAFDKPMSSVRPHFENALNAIDVFPEAQDDRVKVAPSRSRASGAELRLARNAGERAAWWISYARSRAADTIDGRSVPRSWDQPNAASGGMTVQLPNDWSAGFAAAYHTGWPTTPTIAVRTANGLDVVLGPRNSERLPSFFRLDGRISKSFRTRRGALSLSLDVLNLTNHDNVCCVSDSVPYVRDDGALGVMREDRSLLPIFPSLSARWRF